MAMGSPSFFDINVLGFVALEGLPFQLESIIVSIFSFKSPIAQGIGHSPPKSGAI
jgi:hypothetical protein